MGGAAILVLLLALGAEVEEREPNGWDVTDLQVVPFGTTFTGTLSNGGSDVDRFVVECDEDTLATFVMVLPEDQKAQVVFNVTDRMYENVTATGGRQTLIAALHLPEGRSTVAIHNRRNEGIDYRLEMVALKELGERDRECNHRRERATPVPLGEPVDGICSMPGRDDDFFRLEIDRAGPWELKIRKKPLSEDPKERPELYVEIQDAKGRRFYAYRLVPERLEQRYFPVLPEGEVLVRVCITARLGDGYRLTLTPHVPKLTAEEIAAAKRAIDEGVAFLRSGDRGDSSYVVAVESLVLMALEKSEDHVEWLAGLFKPDEKGTWKGEPIQTPDERIYQHAIATLALAEAAEAGDERARELCGRGVTYLLAAQQTGWKCPAWKGPIGAKSGDYGGWRYYGYQTDADISITGWCLVALIAADAAGVRLDGMRDAVTLGARYVNSCSTEEGFAYRSVGGGSGNVRNGIGALISALTGLESLGLRPALADVDRHLPAFSQVGSGPEYPWYYAYYATRLNYLRGGDDWEIWRTAMLRQLLDHRRPDGSWPCYGSERAVGVRFGTALGVLITRMCLNDVPRYLRAEARGF